MELALMLQVVKHEKLYSKRTFWKNIQKIILKREMRQKFQNNFFSQKRQCKRDGRSTIYFTNNFLLLSD